MWSAVIVKMIPLVEGGLLNTGFTVSCDGSLRNTHPLIIQKPMYVSLESLLTRFLSCYWNCRNLTTAGPLHFSERGLPCVWVGVCVCASFLPTGRSYRIVLDLRRTFWPLNKGRHPLLYPAFPLEFFQVAFLPSIANGTRSPWNRVWPNQTLCPL